MDIVKSRIEVLNGTVDVRTEPGQGTTFFIRLPLTLAIMPASWSRSARTAYAIPLDHLDEIVEVRPRQIYRVDGQRSIEIRGRSSPWSRSATSSTGAASPSCRDRCGPATE